MKKLFTILSAVILTATMTFAQKGTVAIGVGSNLANVSWQDYSLIPTVGYFITDNMMVGTGFSMGSSTSEDEYLPGWNEQGELSQRSFNISPFFRYYAGESLFASVGISIGSTSREEDASNALGVNAVGETNTSSFGLNASVGYSLMWNERVCIEPSFGIATSSGSSTVKSNFDGSVTENDSDAPSTFGMAIGLGINIRLGN